MNVFSEKSRSAWHDIGPVNYPRLDATLTADTLVIGSGIAGLSIAYELATRVLSVVVLDRGPIGRGMTARTTAHLTSALDDFYHEFISKRGKEIARLHFESQDAAIQRIAQIQGNEGIDCDFERRDAYLFLVGEEKPKVLDDEADALNAMGLKGEVIQKPALKCESATSVDPARVL